MHVTLSSRWSPVGGAWVSWVSRYFNQTADWLAAQALTAQTACWGWLRQGPVPSTSQVIGWSDGTSSADGAFGWAIVSRGACLNSVTLEGVGGGFTPQCDSMMVESLGFLSLSEALKHRLDNQLPPRSRGTCPQALRTTTYAKIVKELTRPPTGPWASDDANVLAQMYECDWNA